jgi:hypothetical protein
MRGAAALQRRAVARRGIGVGVHHSTRGRHQDDGARPANTTASSRGGDDNTGRRTAEKRGGGAPASRSRRGGARGRLQAVQVAPLPSDEGAETTAGQQEATKARVNGGGAG